MATLTILPNSGPGCSIGVSTNASVKFLNRRYDQTGVKYSVKFNVPQPQLNPALVKFWR
jgi:hypothetical protein